MAEIKAVIFDLNGVLLVSKALSKRLSEKTGKTADDIYTVIKPILKEVRNKVRGGDEVWKPLEETTKMDREELLNFFFSGEAIDREMLEYAKKLRDEGLKLFILSNNFRERTLYYLENFPELFELAEKCYFSWETGYVKPDPVAYENLLNENGLRGDECVYIDDSEENLTTARQFGILGIKYESRDQVIEEINKVIK